MSNAVATKIEAEQMPAVQSETGAIISMIERAAKDPAVDLDKMERLLKMRADIVAEQKQEAFNAAMAKAQGEMRPVAADLSNPQTRSKYASYAALDRAIRPIYTKNGFGLSFDTEDGAPPDHIRLVCYVTNSGHTRKYRADMPSDGKGAKGGDVMTKTHAFGSAATYGQRYLLKMIFNIAVGPDDDGNAAGRGDPITDDQADVIRGLMTETKTDVERFLNLLGAPSIADIRVTQFDDAVALLNAKKKKAVQP